MNIFQEYLKYGFSVIPCNGKIPNLTSWKMYQDLLATQEEAESWKGNVAIICGKVSGGVVILDFDIKNGDLWDEWVEVVTSQFPELMSKLVIETTPSGGKHVIFKTDTKITSVKLACVKLKSETTGKLFNAAMIETRGEGGYFVCAPSTGYAWYYSDIEHVQRLTDSETDFLMSVCRSFNKVIPENVAERHAETTQTSGLMPFDDYNNRASITELLTAHGWKVQFHRGETIYFQRPDKKERGISASWNHIKDRFYVFSTSTNFENGHIYKKSAVYAILEHEGNFNAAAQVLYAAGYGDRIEKKQNDDQPAQPAIIDKKKTRERVNDILRNGYKRGKSTGWKSLDEYFSVVKGQFTVVTGMPSMGKSEFMDALAVNLAVNSDFKFVVFSPENYPVEMHYHKLIEKICKKKMSFRSGMTQSELDRAIDFIDSHFHFIDALENDVTLEFVMDAAQKIIATEKIDSVIIDPWNEVELSKPKDISESDFIGASLRTIRKFARKNDIHLFVVAHPTKMQKDKDGKYPVPELYDIMGSSHWRNKADNGLCVHRDLVVNSDVVDIHTLKIKFKYCGKMGDCQLKYNSESGTYSDIVKTEDRGYEW